MLGWGEVVELSEGYGWNEPDGGSSGVVLELRLDGYMMR